MIELQVRRLRADAVVPTVAYPGDAGLDLAACERVALAPGERYRAVMRTGGRISLTDAADPLSDGALIVEGVTIFLPLVVR